MQQTALIELTATKLAMRSIRFDTRFLICSYVFCSMPSVRGFRSFNLLETVSVNFGNLPNAKLTTEFKDRQLDVHAPAAGVLWRFFTAIFVIVRCRSTNDDAKLRMTVRRRAWDYSAGGRAGERARGTDPTAHRAHARHRYLVPRLMPLARTIAALYCTLYRT